MKSVGGTYLRRMTWANPCADTLSITRLGDTIKIDHHNWMVLELDNDTSAVLACIMLNLLHRQYIDVAELNYIYESCDIEPKDYYYAYATEHIQKSLKANLIGMPKAWGYQVGIPAIKVSIVDAGGIDYRHCDLGGVITNKFPAEDFPTNKFIAGFNFFGDDTHIYEGSPHGTQIAGIIGALTNNEDCGLANADNIAGIAGGWGTLENHGTPKETGVSLMGYRCSDYTFTNTLYLQYAISAILLSSGHSVNGLYGEQADVINASWNKTDNPPSEALRRAVYEAYRHSVSFVAARGNEGENNNKNNAAYPGSFDGNWVISVGAADRFKLKHYVSSYENLADVGLKGRYGVMDIIAPGGEPRPDLYPEDETIYTTDNCVGTNNKIYSNFSKTSAAAAHVSGVVALMRSTVNESSEFFAVNNTHLEPEDYEGILQATAERIVDPNQNKYNQERGWGHLQADNVYTKCAVDGFRAKHYLITDLNKFNKGQWKPIEDYHFITGFNKDLTSIEEKYIGSGFIREIRATYILSADDWDANNLFVWGRGGTEETTGGYNAANPNHQYSWTEVISGTGGINPPSRYVPGIFHNNNLEVECRTYQFKYNNGLTDVYLPIDDKIAFNFTVFGKRISTSVKLSDEVPIQSELIIQPNPAFDQLQILYSLTSHSRITLNILDIMGRNVIKPIVETNTIGAYSERIDISNLGNGVYYCKLTLPMGKVLVQPFLVGVGR